jgi:hypothetical protein
MEFIHARYLHYKSAVQHPSDQTPQRRVTFVVRCAVWTLSSVLFNGSDNPHSVTGRIVSRAAEIVLTHLRLTYIHTYMPWIHKSVEVTTGCAISHNIQIYRLYNFTFEHYKLKHYKRVTYLIMNHLYTHKIHLLSKRSVYLSIFLMLL